MPPFILKANDELFTGLKVQLATSELTANKGTSTFSMDAFGFTLDQGTTYTSWANVSLVNTISTNYTDLSNAIVTERNQRNASITSINNTISTNYTDLSNAIVTERNQRNASITSINNELKTANGISTLKTKFTVDGIAIDSGTNITKIIQNTGSYNSVTDFIQDPFSITSP
jgi:hypothetical protein